MESIELEIRITGLGGRRFRATVERSPTGPGGSRTFELPDVREFPPGGVDWRDVGRPAARRDKSARLLLHEQGSSLFKLIFQGDVLVAFDSAYRLARQRELWFRLQFSFDFAPEAVNLPWEGLIGPEGWPLGRLDKISIERRLIKPPAIEAPAPSVPGKIRVLVVGAGPNDLPPLDLKKEIRWIKAALREIAEVHELRDATEQKLSQAMAEGQRFDVIHFLGHGDFESEEGGLWLVKESGEGERLTSSELPFVLLQPVPFVFLNVCHGGRSSANPFAGLAEGLVRAGVRVVVAMRREISDPGALKLAKSFYQQVARKDSLTRALAKARREVDSAQGDWAVPLLFLAGEDLELLPSEKPAPAPAPELAKTSRPQWPWLLLPLLGTAALGSLFFPTPDPPPVEPPLVPFDARCPSPAGLEFSFVHVEPGSFSQGSPKDEDEKPVHPVTLTGAFCVSAFEVTRGLHAQVMGQALPAGLDRYYPAEGLTWDESQQFLARLNELHPGAQFRLPTSAEWEYAARAGRPGDEDEPAPANCRGRSEHDPYQNAASVGRFQANAWGLYDMKGNLWEWVQDWYTPYTKDPAVDPRGPETGDKKVRRGGSYENNAKNCRFSTRAGVQPGREQEAAGLRIARSPVTEIPLAAIQD